MNMVDYDFIIEKYIAKDTDLYEIYYTHVSLVTEYALDIASNLSLDTESMRFIEEAAMLHDIGIIEVDHPEINCCGKLPYIQHLIAGRRILEEEGLPKHAMVAMRHCSPNLTIEFIKENEIELPEDDYTPQNREEMIIGFSDLFFSKVPCREALTRKRPFNEVLDQVEGYRLGTSGKVLEWARELEVNF